MVCRHPPTCPRGADQGRAITRAPNITRRALSGAPDRHIRAWLVLRTERRIWRGLDGRVACSGASFGRAPQPGARGWMIFGSSTALTGKLRTPVFSSAACRCSRSSRSLATLPATAGRSQHDRRPGRRLVRRSGPAAHRPRRGPGRGDRRHRYGPERLEPLRARVHARRHPLLRPLSRWDEAHRLAARAPRAGAC
jgi:hypothetical protein